MKSKWLPGGLLLPCLATTLLFSGHQEAVAAETRSFVVNWFYLASYFSDGDCPDGLNPSSAEFYRRDLLRAGHAKEEVETVLKDFPGEGGAPQPWIQLVIVRGDNKTNVYADPTTTPDPKLKTVGGRFAYGFNLDGLGDKSPNGFEDPITHEHGIDNQAYRAFSCIRGFRGSGRSDGPAPSNADEVHWDKLREDLPAMVVSVTAPNGFTTDGDVSVVIGRALEPVTRDASGSNVQADMTYRLDPDPRTRNAFTAHLHGGEITADPGRISLIGDNYMVASFDFDKARLRLELKPNGAIEGLIGGYMPWYPIYHGLSVGGYVEEYALSLDLPGLYFALKKLADGDPDPKTGENRSISAAYAIEGIRAFVVDPGQQKSAANLQPNAMSGAGAQ